MNWYYAVGSERKGPVNDEGFAELIRAGAIQDSTLVWKEGMAGWEPYSAIRIKAVSPVPQQAFAAAPAAASPMPFCTQCGRQFPSSDLVAIGDRLVCVSCKPIVLQQMREGTASIAGRTYAGFWIRFVAVLIDGVLLGAVNMVISIAVIGSAMFTGSDFNETAMFGRIMLQYFINFGIGVAYESWFLVNKGATLGKMALGLKVVRANGGPITWGLAIGRYFAKIVSGLILAIGYIMAAFDDQKRSLHDRICDTRVVKG